MLDAMNDQTAYNMGSHVSMTKQIPVSKIDQSSRWKEPTVLTNLTLTVGPFNIQKLKNVFFKPISAHFRVQNQKFLQKYLYRNLE